MSAINKTSYENKEAVFKVPAPRAPRERKPLTAVTLPNFTDEFQGTPRAPTPLNKRTITPNPTQGPVGERVLITKRATSPFSAPSKSPTSKEKTPTDVKKSVSSSSSSSSATSKTQLAKTPLEKGTTSSSSSSSSSSAPPSSSSSSSSSAPPPPPVQTAPPVSSSSSSSSTSNSTRAAPKLSTNEQQIIIDGTLLLNKHDLLHLNSFDANIGHQLCLSESLERLKQGVNKLQALSPASPEYAALKTTLYHEKCISLAHRFHSLPFSPKRLNVIAQLKTLQSQATDPNKPPLQAIIEKLYNNLNVEFCENDHFFCLLALSKLEVELAILNGNLDSLLKPRQYIEHEARYLHMLDFPKYPVATGKPDGTKSPVFNARDASLNFAETPSYHQVDTHHLLYRHCINYKYHHYSYSLHNQTAIADGAATIISNTQQNKLNSFNLLQKTLSEQVREAAFEDFIFYSSTLEFIKMYPNFHAEGYFIENRIKTSTDEALVSAYRTRTESLEREITSTPTYKLIEGNLRSQYAYLKQNP